MLLQFTQRKWPGIAAAGALLLWLCAAFAQAPEPDGAVNQAAARAYIREDYARILFPVGEDTAMTARVKGRQVAVRFDRPVVLDISGLAGELQEYLEGVAMAADGRGVLLVLKRDDLKVRNFAGAGVAGIDLIHGSGKRGQAEEDMTGPPLPPEFSAKEDGNVSDGAELSAPQISGGEMTPGIARGKGGGRIILPWPDGVSSLPAAAFVRGGGLWIVLGAPLLVKTGELTNLKYISSAEQFPVAGHAVLRLAPAPEFSFAGESSSSAGGKKLRVFFHQEKSSWIIEFREGAEEASGDAAPPAPKTVNVEAIPVPGKKIPASSDEGGQVMLHADNPAPATTIMDPGTGGTLAVIPLAGSAAVTRARRFVDFELPETMQGIVIRRLSDALEYAADKKGVLLTSPQTLRISPELYGKDGEAVASRAATKRHQVALPETSIFPFPPPAPAKKQIAPAETTGEAPEGSAHGEKGQEEASNGKENNQGGEHEVKEEKAEAELAQQEQAPALPSFAARENELFQALAAAAKDKVDRRLEIAEFYFFRSMYGEALGMLREIKTRDPGYAKTARVDLLSAACHYLMHHYEEAEASFGEAAGALSQDAALLANEAEINFWRWASAAQRAIVERRKIDQTIPVDYIASYDKFMKFYPPELRHRFGLLAADYFLGRNETDAARTVVEIISYEGIPPGLENDTMFVQASIAQAGGNAEEAVRNWTVLAGDVNDRHNRARAMVALTQHRLLKGEMPVKQALEEFEKARTVWRGSDLEIDLLKLIGQLYLNEKDYFKGLKAWQTLTEYYPDTRDALFISGKMRQTFVSLFEKSGKAYELPPLKALALYFEFRDLTPPGERGDQMVQLLTDHFIQADLLDSAAALLTHQIRFRTHGERKTELALKLAGLELDNRNPPGALAALEYVGGDAPAETMASKRHLTARAQIAMDKLDLAMDTLRGDFSSEADDVRLDIFWAKRNWFGIIRILEPRLPDIENTRPRPLTAPQTGQIVRLAVAYAIQEERDKLRKLRGRFGERVTEFGRRASDVFDFVTHDIANVSHAAFERTVQLQEIERFLDIYAFWPGHDWKNVVKVLAPRVEKLKRTEPPLSREEARDVVRLAIAYAMQKDDKDAQRGLQQLSLDFRSVMVDRTTIEVFRVLDDRFRGKEENAIFDGKVPLKDVPAFIPRYQAASSIVELNAAGR